MDSTLVCSFRMYRAFEVPKTEVTLRSKPCIRLPMKLPTPSQARSSRSINLSSQLKKGRSRRCRWSRNELLALKLGKQQTQPNRCERSPNPALATIGSSKLSILKDCPAPWNLDLWALPCNQHSQLPVGLWDISASTGAIKVYSDFRNRSIEPGWSADRLPFARKAVRFGSSNI